MRQRALECGGKSPVPPRRTKIVATYITHVVGVSLTTQTKKEGSKKKGGVRTTLSRVVYDDSVGEKKLDLCLLFSVFGCFVFCFFFVLVFLLLFFCFFGFFFRVVLLRGLGLFFRIVLFTVVFVFA